MSLYEAISEIQNDETISLVKNETGQVQSRQYKYLTIDKLHQAVFPKLKEHGLVWITCPTWIDDEDPQPALEYRLIDVTGMDEIQGTVPLCLAKQDPQGLGAAITYCRRYTLLSVLGLVGEDDTDGVVPQQVEREGAPTIPLDRASRILRDAEGVGLVEDGRFQPALTAKLTEVGVETGKIGHLNVDQAEQVEYFIEQEAQ